jgi:hypothetical protein
MDGSEGREASSDLFEEAYIAYIKAVQRAWAAVDVEDVVRQARSRGLTNCLAWLGCMDCYGATFTPAELSITPMGCWSCLGGSPGGCIGTYGTHGTYGTYGSRAAPGPAESTER